MIELQLTDPTIKEKTISLRYYLQFEYFRKQLIICLRIVHEDMETTFSEFFHLYCKCLHGFVIGDVEVKTSYPGRCKMSL